MSAGFVAKNKTYLESFDKGDLDIVPSKRHLVVTCMDGRVDPATQLGIGLGEAHIVRNAGGSAAEAMRSIITSQHLLGIPEITILHHTDCGMLRFESEQIRKIVKDKDPGNTVVAEMIDNIDFLTFKDVEGSVKQDVKYLKEHPLVLKDSLITGWVYDVRTGAVKQVV